jgi:hypothetical protein
MQTRTGSPVASDPLLASTTNGYGAAPTETTEQRAARLERENAANEARKNALFGWIYTGTAVASDVLFAFLLSGGVSHTLRSFAAYFGADLSQEDADRYALAFSLMDALAMCSAGMYIPEVREGLYNVYFKSTVNPFEQIDSSIASLSGSPTPAQKVAAARSVLNTLAPEVLAELNKNERISTRLARANAIIASTDTTDATKLQQLETDVLAPAREDAKLKARLVWINRALIVTSFAFGATAPAIAFAGKDLATAIGLGVWGFVGQFLLYLATAGGKPGRAADALFNLFKAHKTAEDPTWADYGFNKETAWTWIESFINCTARALTFAFLGQAVISIFTRNPSDAIKDVGWGLLALSAATAFYMNFTTQSLPRLIEAAKKHHHARTSAERHRDEDALAPVAAAPLAMAEETNEQKIERLEKELKTERANPGSVAYVLAGICCYASVAARTASLPAFTWESFAPGDLKDGTIHPAVMASVLLLGLVAYARQWPGFLLDDGAKGWKYLADSTLWAKDKIGDGIEATGKGIASCIWRNNRYQRLGAAAPHVSADGTVNHA